MKRIAPFVLILFAACTASAPVKPEAALLPEEPEVVRDGAPFPRITPYDPAFPEPRRTLRVDSASELQDALCRLEPGDRLIVAPVVYRGAFQIAGPCRDGRPDAPIQVFTQDAFLEPDGDRAVLTVERAHWQFRHLQIALRDSDAMGVVLRGAGAHHIAIDRAHIADGDGKAIRIDGATDISLSNGHIHHSGGVSIGEGAARVRLVNNHIHHNRGTAVAIDGSREIELSGNRVHNDAGAAEVLDSTAIRITRNKIWNYPTVAAMTFAGSGEVVVEENAVVAATVAIDGSEGIRLRDNIVEGDVRARAPARK